MNEYINLLKKVLIDHHRTGTEYTPMYPTGNWKVWLLIKLDAFLRRKDYAIGRVNEYRMPRKFISGTADSMISLERMDNIEFCVNSILKDGIEGDFIETGVWRGGAVILMKAILKLHNDNRTVWLADSFAGLPPPDAKYPADKGDRYHLYNEYVASMDEVKKRFAAYDLLDDNVKFLKGWFKDTLPSSPIKKLALLRLDGDMYGSTIEALDALYPKLSPGGYCIVDDYGMKGCKQAVDDYRKEHNISEEIVIVDNTGVYWRKN